MVIFHTSSENPKPVGRVVSAVPEVLAGRAT